MGQGDHSSWTRDSRFKPLLDALQEAIDHHAKEGAKYPGDHPEYTRGFIAGLVRAKGMAGYYSQYSLQEEAEIRAMMESPEAKEELAQAEARLAAGDVRGAEEVRARREVWQPKQTEARGSKARGQESRIRSRLEPAGQSVVENTTSQIQERLEPSVESTDEPEIDG